MAQPHNQLVKSLSGGCQQQCVMIVTSSGDDSSLSGSAHAMSIEDLINPPSIDQIERQRKTPAS
eukprot:1115169-Amphidinium_carterae.1